MVPSFFPAQGIFGVAGLEEAKNRSGENVLRLIQIRLMCPVYAQNCPYLVKLGGA
ncbi:MAG: hypothetical protein WA849_03815 [Candidatus Udaeobacter sp.]